MASRASTAAVRRRPVRTGDRHWLKYNALLILSLLYYYMSHVQVYQDTDRSTQEGTDGTDFQYRMTIENSENNFCHEVVHFN